MSGHAADGSPRLVETHVSILFFIGDHVYKMKKPVAFGFVDLTSGESRRLACERELELNRRLAPDVYLGVAEVLLPQGGSEHLVVMRRLPVERRLTQLLSSGVDVSSCVEQVARAIARLHGESAHGPEVDASATCEHVEGSWAANLREIEEFVGRYVDGESVDLIAGLSARYLAGRKQLFDQRVANGRAVDGHGDLRAEDIYCMEDGPRILDCLEFDDRLRFGDALCDAAFLAMDLEHENHRREAEMFLAAYSELSGDVFPRSLLDHYVAFRALIRAKVSCIRGSQEGSDPSAEVDALLELCVDHLRRGEVTLVLVGGLPGSGKSTLAAGLAKERGWSVLRSDVVRKEIGRGSKCETTHRFGEGIYSAETTQATYGELLRRAEVSLSMGESAILDASWVDDRWRQAARQLAERTNSRLVEMCCTIGKSLAVERVTRRAVRGTDPSDATEEILEEMSEVAMPWPSATAIDTSGTVSATLRQAVRLLDSR